MKIISKKSGKAGEVIEEKMVNSKLTYIVQFDGAKNRVAVLAANCEVVKEADHLPEVGKEVPVQASGRVLTVKPIKGSSSYLVEEVTVPSVDLNQFRTLWSPVEHFLSHPEDMPVNPYLKNPARKPVGYERDVILAECEMEARAALPILKPDPLKPPSAGNVKTARLPPPGVHKYI